MLEAALAAGVAVGRRARAARRRAAHARAPRCSCAATGSTWRRSCPPRTTPTQDNGIKFFGPDGTKLADAQEARDRALVLDAAGRARHRPRARPARRRGRLRARARGALRASSTCPGAGSCSTAPTAPPTGSRPEIFRRLGADLDARGGRARRPQHQPRLRLHARGGAGRAGASRRLRHGLRLRRRRRPRAGGGPQRRGGGRRRADGARRAPPARARPAARRRRGGHGDDQLRLPPRHGARPASRWPPPRWGTATCSPSCCAAAGRSAASSRATSSTPASCPRATAPRPRC